MAWMCYAFVQRGVLGKISTLRQVHHSKGSGGRSRDGESNRVRQVDEKCPKCQRATSASPLAITSQRHFVDGDWISRWTSNRSSKAFISNVRGNMRWQCWGLWGKESRTQMELEIVIRGEVSKDKDMISLTCGIKKGYMNLSTKQTYNNTCRKETYSYWGISGEKG